jgi:hypothetical protein
LFVAGASVVKSVEGAGSVWIVHGTSVVLSVGVVPVTSVDRSVVVDQRVSVVDCVDVVLARGSTTREVVRDSLHINCWKIVTGRTWRR